MPLPWLDWNWSWVLWMLASWPQIHVNNVNVSFAIPTLSLSLNRFPLCRQNFWPTSKSDWKLFLRTIMKREKRSSTTIGTVTATAAHAEHKRRRTLCRVSCRSLLINNVLIYTIVVPEDQKCLTVWQFTAVQMKDERWKIHKIRIEDHISTSDTLRAKVWRPFWIRHQLSNYLPHSARLYIRFGCDLVFAIKFTLNTEITY